MALGRLHEDFRSEKAEGLGANGAEGDSYVKRLLHVSSGV